MDVTPSGMPILKSDYFEKKLFIREFIALCRFLKKQEGRKPSFLAKSVGVCGEFWQFHIYVGKDKRLSTDATLYDLVDGHYVGYMKTKWGGCGQRWDYELREFLNREIDKEV